MKEKRCAELQIFHSTPHIYLTNDVDEMTIPVYDHSELASMYTVPGVVNGLSRLTTNEQARSIRKFSNRPITFESNRIGTADSNSNRISKLRRSLAQGHPRSFILQSLTGQRRVAYRHIILLALSLKFPKK